METILRFLNARSFFAAGVLIGAVLLADRFREYPVRWYQQRMDARERGGPGALAPDIAKDLQARESLKLQSLYRSVGGEIARARADGFEVSRLQALADRALALDKPGFRDTGIEMLNKVRMAVPRKSEGLRVATPDDEKSDMPPTPKATNVRRRRRARSR